MLAKGGWVLKEPSFSGTVHLDVEELFDTF